MTIYATFHLLVMCFNYSVALKVTKINLACILPVFFHHVLDNLFNLEILIGKSSRTVTSDIYLFHFLV